MTGKRWAGVDAYEHIQLVEAGILPRGLSYLSAYDYIGSPSHRTRRPKKTRRYPAVKRRLSID